MNTRITGAKIVATRDITVIIVFNEGPAVSLKGSPTVSPVTAALWASEPLPPYAQLQRISLHCPTCHRNLP